jgi:hypothetical protein
MAKKKSLKVYRDYTKTHKNQKAAKSHAARIRKRGGMVSVEKTSAGYRVRSSYKK